MRWIAGRTRGSSVSYPRTLVALGIALLAGASWGAPVAAASPSVIGDVSLGSNAPNLDSIGQQIPVFQGDAGPGYVVSSPVTGTLTTWMFRSGGATPGSTFVLRVLRPPSLPGGPWTGAGTSAAEAVTGAAGADNVLGPFSTSLPITAGDRVALEPLDGPVTPIETGTLGSDGIRYFVSPLSDGASEALAPGSGADSGQVVPIQATVTPAPAPPAVTAPGNLTPPSISGTPAAGNTLTCDPGTWSGSPTSFAYSWIAGDPAAPSFTLSLGSTQSIALEDLETNAVVECSVHATNAAGTTSAGAANPVRVSPSPPALATNLEFILPPSRRVRLNPNPMITPGVGVGGTNFCTPGHWMHFPESYSYRWYRSLRGRFPAPDNRGVGGGPVLKLPAKVDHYFLACRVTASNGAGFRSAFSNSYFIGTSQLLLVPGAKIKISVNTGVGGSRLNPTTSHRHPIRSLSLSFRCLRPAVAQRGARISYSWAISSRLSGGRDPFDQVFPGQTLSLRTLAGGVRIDRTDVPALARLDGTVRCITTVRKGRTAAVILGSSVHVLGAS
jgi:hypothetical protein